MTRRRPILAAAALAGVVGAIFGGWALRVVVQDGSVPFELLPVVGGVRVPEVECQGDASWGTTDRRATAQSGWIEVASSAFRGYPVQRHSRVTSAGGTEYHELLWPSGLPRAGALLRNDGRGGVAIEFVQYCDDQHRAP